MNEQIKDSLILVVYLFSYLILLSYIISYKSKSTFMNFLFIIFKVFLEFATSNLISDITFVKFFEYFCISFFL